MITAPLPDDEAERLAALRATGLLDSPPEQEFDDLARIASAICGTPIALVSLVDERRQWFKARVGIEARETPRAQAFCAHAILGDDVFVVPDATADPRFWDNPLVTVDPLIRFYAGAPLSDAEGHHLGTLCAIDRRPRQLEKEQLEALQALARQASALIQLRQTGRALWRARWELEGLLQQTSLLVQLSDRDGRLRFVNHAWRTALDYPGDLSALRVEELLAPEERDAHGPLLRNPGAPREVALTMIGRDGRRLRVQGSVSPGPEERDPADCRVLAVLRDVTEFVAIERARAEMVATVSHELRTPLTSISAAVGLLRAGAGGVLPPEAGELVGIAEANALRLRQLVDDILDLEKIEGARVELQAVPVEVAELVRSGLEVVGAMARVRQVRVEAGAVEGTPPIRGDARRLVQVLANLLSNAVKHSPPGGAVRVEAAAGPERVRIAVTDEGPGIPPAEQQRVFERFHQLTGKEGTGLGLAIARALVRQHGGEIGVESPPGSGARFWFEIPRADAGPAQPRS